MKMTKRRKTPECSKRRIPLPSLVSETTWVKHGLTKLKVKLRTGKRQMKTTTKLKKNRSQLSQVSLSAAAIASIASASQKW